MAWSVQTRSERKHGQKESQEMKYQVLSNNNQYYWRLLASNGKIIAVSGEYYVRKADCLHGINLVKASVVSQYEIYQDVQKQWRWRLQATNGQIIAISS